MSIWKNSRAGLSPATIAFFEEADRRARLQHPERYAPDGDPLIAWAGRDWFERLNSWRVAHAMPIIERPHQLHALPESRTKHVNTYSDERHPS